MAQPTRTKFTAADYFQLDIYAQNNLIQLIDGEFIVGMPPILKHQRIIRHLWRILLKIADAKDAELFDSPIEVYLDENNVYQPDMLYIKPDNPCANGEKRINGAPNLIVEILSPSTAKYDKTTKFDAYQQHGVEEYWIVDPVHDIIDVWKLNDDGLFTLQGAYAIGDEFVSVTLGETIKVEEIFSV